MLVRLHHDPRAFVELVEPFLLAQEAENTQPLAIARSFVDTAAHDGLMLSVESGADVVCAAVKTPKRNLIVTRGPATALRALAAYLDRYDLPVPGIVGPRDAADAFCDAWTAITRATCHERTRLRLFALAPQAVANNNGGGGNGAPRDVSGRFRLAHAGDGATVERWLHAFVDEATHDRHDNVRARVRPLIDGGCVGLWDDNGPASMAAVTRRVGRGAHVAWVYTPPARRGHGYASACVAALSTRELQAGRAFCTLYADLANASSNALYERLGYRAICDAVDVVFVEAA